jgi:hypothetical protein
VPKAVTPTVSKAVTPTVPKAPSLKPSNEESKPVEITYEQPLSAATIKDVISRTKSRKSTAKLITDYSAGIMPSTPEDETRLRSALVEMAASKLLKKSKGKDPTSLIESAVSKVKKSNTVQQTSLLTSLSKNANKSAASLKPEPNVTLKQNRSIPVVKLKSKSRPDKSI